MRHGSRKRRKTTLRIYLYLYNSLRKSDSRGNGNIANARAGYKHAGENVCRQKFIQRKTTWLWSVPLTFLPFRACKLLYWAVISVKLPETTTWSSFKMIEPLFKNLPKISEGSSVLKWDDRAGVENVRDERNPKGGNLCNDATIQRKMKFSIESGSL